MSTKLGRGEKKIYSGCLIFPILLIVAGIFLLLNTLDILRGDLIDLLWRLWPVLFFAIGLDLVLRKKSLAGGAILICLSILFLLNNYKCLENNLWILLLEMWPIFLIAVGLDLLVTRNFSILAYLFGLVVILAVLFGSLWLLWISKERSLIRREVIEQPISGAIEAGVFVKSEIADLDLMRNKGSQILIDGLVPGSSSGVYISDNYLITDEFGNYIISLSDISLPPYGGFNRWDWDLYLTTAIPLDLNIMLMFGDAEIDLRELKIKNYLSRVAVGNVSLSLPNKGQFNTIIDVDIGQITVIVPTGMEVWINLKTGLAIVDVPDDYYRSDTGYKSPDFDTSMNKVKLDLNIDLGRIKIIQE